MKSKKGLYIGLLIFLIAAIAVVILLGSKDDTGISVATTTPRPSNAVVIKEVDKMMEIEKVLYSEEMQSGLRDLGVLITEEYYFTDVISFSSIKSLLSTDIQLKFTESSYLATYDGVVTAGIDFTAASVSADENNRKMTIRLPKAQIQQVSIDPDSFVLHSEKVGLGNPLSVEDFNSSLKELEDSARAKAESKGLLDRANENARTVVSNFVSGLVDPEEYTIEIITI